ncbi:ABC transporter B family member 26, chloroplastic-like isoform X1 [Primulina huaijiensis]|uniref:ABC transporter B family member 26, chloroplastic-like isoform X1 n=1 Tax=Primulina huaijiensis TaxID=1492673 RepID=UPI003CC6FC6B
MGILETTFNSHLFLGVLQVKLPRETLFSPLSRDMSFFDSEAVGDLTSRISVDCQRLSHTIGNDIHLILRNILQVPEKSSKACSRLPKKHCLQSKQSGRMEQKEKSVKVFEVHPMA